MAKKFDPHNKDRLLTPERYGRMPPEEWLRLFGLKAGDVCADIGCGPGYFTVPAAQIVGPAGHVYAADLQSEMLATVAARVKESGLTNVDIIKAGDSSVPLPPASCDLIWIAFVLHEVSARAGFLHQLRQALKPGGRLVVVEWEKAPSDEGPPLDRRISADEVLADLRAAGYAVSERRQLDPAIYAFAVVPVSGASQTARAR
jgi:ubiquinone/menaquinone biosynthesis C-methylase UbiE